MSIALRLLVSLALDLSYADSLTSFVTLLMDFATYIRAM